jgi:hypothetical protein
MASTPGTLRRTPIALAVALALVAGTLAIGLNVASAATPVRKYSASLQSPACIKAGTRVTFTATFKNDSMSNRMLGSAKIDSDDNATSFLGIADIAITSKPTGKTWTAAPDHANPDGVILKATSSSSALSAGQSVSVTFSAVAPSMTGPKTWKTFAWESTFYTTSFTRTSPYPTVLVSATCVGPPTTIAFVSGPFDTVGGGVMADVKVKVTDSANNALSGQSVVLTSDGLQTSPTLAQLTDGSGVATFSGASLTVKPAVASGVSMTASDGGLNTSATYNIVPGTPSQITFTKQPTDTLVDTAISAPGGVEVKVLDANNNPVPGVMIGLGISPSSLTPGAGLGGGDPVATDANGLASFTNLKIDTSSSGYLLRTTVGDVDSGTFAITNTDSSCTNDCTATLPNGGTVSAPQGTTLIVENGPVVFCGDFTGFAGTVTVIPSGSGNIELTFVDPYTDPGEPHPQVGVTYPFCKGSASNPGTGTLLQLPADQCDPSPNPPCIKSQVFITGPLDLQTVLVIDGTDPPVRH